jgi:tetratricopeptide (TPR) repeat protein
LEGGYSQAFREGVHHAAEHWLSFVHQHRADTSAVMEKRGHILRLLAWSFNQPGASGVAAALIRTLHHHMMRAAPWSLWEIYLRAALVACRAGRNRLGEVDILHHYGDFLLRAGRLEEALAVARDAQALLAGLDDARRSCVNHAVFIGIYLNMGRYEPASRHAQAGADLARAAEDDVLLADALIGLGRAQLEQGEPEAALEPLQQALELTRRADSLVFEAKAAVFLGHAYAALEQWPDAAEMHQLSHSLTHRFGDRAGMGVTLKNLGLALVMAGQVEEGSNVLQESVTISQELGNWPILTVALCYLSEAYRCLERDVEAENAARQARRLVKEHGLEEMLHGLGMEGGKHAVELIRKVAWPRHQATLQHRAIPSEG